MINYSIWNFNKFNNLNDFLEVLNENRLENRSSGKAYGNLTLKNEIYNYDTFGNININNVHLFNEDVRYIPFCVNAQGCRKNAETDLYEVKDIAEKVVVYEKNNVVKVVILASQNNAIRIIKKVFHNKLVWGEIEEDNYITEDMLYWLFYRLREVPDDAITESPEMYLNGIVSYLGRTNDKINVVRGLGIRVSALLGTLGMLLGEESLRALRPNISFNQDEINIELYCGNSGKLYEKTYRGPLRIIDDEISKLKIVLLVCRYILPNIQKGYKDCCEKNDWSMYIKRIFLRGIGNEMQEKISREMKSINYAIKEYEELELDDSDFSNLEEELEEEDLESEIE